MIVWTPPRPIGALQISAVLPSLALAAELDRTDEDGTLHLGLLLCSVFVTSEQWARRDRHWEDRSYGFSVNGGTLWLTWGLRRWRIRPQGDWTPRHDLHTATPRGERPFLYRWQHQARQQRVTATITEHLRVWQWRVGWIRLPLYRRERSIDVAYSEALGDQRLTRRGGTLHARVHFRRGEHWADAYRRLQATANYCRGR